MRETTGRESGGVLLMAYGTPQSLDGVADYYTHIRRGRPPAPEQLAELVGRYRAIGGVSPLYEITVAEGRLLEAELARRGRPWPVYLGMKHSRPFIADTVRQMAADGIQRAAAIVLAPHFSALSVGVYLREAQEAAALAGGPELSCVERWHLQPALQDALTARLRAALRLFDEAERRRLKVIFSAHSLPERIVAQGDPYPQELLATSRALAERLSLPDWTFGWQSAGRTDERWLGPDIRSILERLPGQGCAGVLLCPVGFVSDHLEVLYDLDIEARRRARELGLHMERTESLNADPLLGAALADAILEVMPA